ncbi:MAG TPA: IPT/TIG domain-containing protein, partial [Candidatus Saccharimonadales bacterium]|nr:IPT/TIG domain-containing protein [Candidatus Saccharimonadales bacterium]
MKRSVLFLLLALSVALAGCAETYFPGGNATGGGISALTVSPGTASIAGLSQQQFLAKLGDGSKPSSVNWMVNGVAGGDATNGTIDANGLYTAPEFPPAVNSVTVTATVPADTRKTGTSAVTLDNPVPVLTSVSPNDLKLGAFTLAITGAHFAQGATVFFGATALTTTYVSSTQLTATGTATTAQIGNVTVTVQNPSPGPSVSAGVTAHVDGGIAVQVTPATGTLRVGAQQAFTATVSGTTNTAVTWAVNGVAGGNTTVGTVDATGNYSAPVIV